MHATTTMKQRNSETNSAIAERTREVTSYYLELFSRTQAMPSGGY